LPLLCCATLRTPHDCPAAAPHHGLGGKQHAFLGEPPGCLLLTWPSGQPGSTRPSLGTWQLLPSSLLGTPEGGLPPLLLLLRPLSRTGLASQPPPAMAAHLGSLLAPQGPHNQHSTEGAALSQPFVLRSTPLLGSQGLRWILWRLTACTVALAEQPSNSSLHQHPCRCLQTTSATTAEGHFQQSCGSWSQSCKSGETLHQKL